MKWPDAKLHNPHIIITHSSPIHTCLSFSASISQTIVDQSFTSLEVSSHINTHYTHKMTTNCGTDELSFYLDMQERFQWLKQNERTRYMCPDYTNPLQYTSSTDGDWQERLQGILDERKHNISWLHKCAGELGLHSTVFSTAVSIFDRYLSTFVPAYVMRELAFLEYDLQTIALASLFLAVKSMMANVTKVNEMPYSPIGDVIRKFGKYYGSLTRQVFKDKVETTILMALDWNIVHTPPIAIVYDFLCILPPPCEYDEGREEELLRYQFSVMSYADKLTRWSELMSGFTIKYPPSTIALASLSIALQDQLGIEGISIYLACGDIELMKRGIDFSFDDEDVLRCRNDMMHYFFPTKAINKDTAERVTGSTDSPTTVAAEVHKRRRTTKKRNSFVAKSA